MEFPKYSVLMSIYKNDKPDWLETALDSMINQIVSASEYVIIQDGPISEDLANVLNKCNSKSGGLFKLIPLEKSGGLGAALRFGVTKCSYEYIARMDSDDISEPTRCEKILEYMLSHKQVSLAGCNVDEFIGDKTNVVGKVRLPLNPEDVKKYAKVRVPIRHSSIIFKKSDILSAGNYRNLKRSQEYDLVVRLLMKNYQIGNIPEVLQFMRVDNDFYKRRGGLQKAKMLVSQRHDFYKYGFYNFFEFILFASINFTVCIVPNGVRKWIYKNILRKQ